MERLTKPYGENKYAIKSEILNCADGIKGMSELLSTIQQKLGEYENAEENGLLVRLPCKIGDEVTIDFQNGYILRDKIEHIHIDIDGKVLYNTKNTMEFYEVAELGKEIILKEYKFKHEIKELKTDDK
jgi:hypothetical protein